MSILPTRRWLLAIALAGSCIAAATLHLGCSREADKPPPPRPLASNGNISEQVHQFCAACHAYPPPDSFPRSAWKEEVERGYAFFGQSGLRSIAWRACSAAARNSANASVAAPACQRCSA